jgi:ParB family chromosome partitioning protein
MITRDVEIALIDLSPDQARTEYDEAQLNELANSIARIGLINPITLALEKGRFKLVAGSRRLRAFVLLGRDHIQAIILNRSNTDHLAIMAHENLFRTDLSPIEEAQFLQHLIKGGQYTPKQLAHLMNKSQSFIDNRLELLNLDEETQAAVHAGELPIGHAIHLSQIDNPDVRRQYTQYAISSGASLRTIVYWIQQYETYKAAPPATDTLPTQVKHEGQLSAFGWHCYICDNFHEAPQVQTIHLCNPCYLEIAATLKGSPPNKS